MIIAAVLYFVGRLKELSLGLWTVTHKKDLNDVHFSKFNQINDSLIPTIPCQLVSLDSIHVSLHGRGLGKN